MQNYVPHSLLSATSDPDLSRLLSIILAGAARARSEGRRNLHAIFCDKCQRDHACVNPRTYPGASIIVAGFPIQIARVVISSSSPSRCWVSVSLSLWLERNPLMVSCPMVGCTLAIAISVLVGIWLGGRFEYRALCSCGGHYIPTSSFVAFCLECHALTKAFEGQRGTVATFAGHSRASYSVSSGNNRSQGYTYRCIGGFGSYLAEAPALSSSSGASGLPDNS